MLAAVIFLSVLVVALGAAAVSLFLTAKRRRPPQADQVQEVRQEVKAPAPRTERGRHLQRRLEIMTSRIQQRIREVENGSN